MWMHIGVAYSVSNVCLEIQTYRERKLRVCVHVCMSVWCMQACMHEWMCACACVCTNEKYLGRAEVHVSAVFRVRLVSPHCWCGWFLGIAHTCCNLILPFSQPGLVGGIFVQFAARCTTDRWHWTSHSCPTCDNQRSQIFRVEPSAMPMPSSCSSFPVSTRSSHGSIMWQNQGQDYCLRRCAGREPFFAMREEQ